MKRFVIAAALAAFTFTASANEPPCVDDIQNGVYKTDTAYFKNGWGGYNGLWFCTLSTGNFDLYSDKLRLQANLYCSARADSRINVSYLVYFQLKEHEKKASRCTFGRKSKASRGFDGASLKVIGGFIQKSKAKVNLADGLRTTAMVRQ